MGCRVLSPRARPSASSTSSAKKMARGVSYIWPHARNVEGSNILYPRGPRRVNLPSSTPPLPCLPRLRSSCSGILPCPFSSPQRGARLRQRRSRRCGDGPAVATNELPQREVRSSGQRRSYCPTAAEIRWWAVDLKVPVNRLPCSSSEYYFTVLGLKFFGGNTASFVATDLGTPRSEM